MQQIHMQLTPLTAELSLVSHLLNSHCISVTPHLCQNRAQTQLGSPSGHLWCRTFVEWEAGRVSWSRGGALDEGGTITEPPLSSSGSTKGEKQIKQTVTTHCAQRQAPSHSAPRFNLPASQRQPIADCCNSDTSQRRGMGAGS